jgi:hypothetical protein
MEKWRVNKMDPIGPINHVGQKKTNFSKKISLKYDLILNEFSNVFLTVACRQKNKEPMKVSEELLDDLLF